jgi:very-short-patch-repair endonuclease
MPKTSMHADASPEIFELAVKLRNNRTVEEIKVWQFLKTSPLDFKFRQQHPFGPYILDFYCHKAQLSIEIDGNNHLQKSQKNRDKIRTAYLNEMGIQELRFTNQEVNSEIEKVEQKIFTFLKSKLHPSPRGRGDIARGSL